MNGHEYRDICIKKEEFERLNNELHKVMDLVCYADDNSIKDDDEFFIRISMSLANGVGEKEIVISNKDSLYTNLISILKVEAELLGKQIKELK